MRLIKMLVCAALVGCGSVFLAQGCSSPQETQTNINIVTLPKPEVAPLENARRASFMISSSQENFSGTGVLIGRRLTENGYEYRALTAYHVIDAANQKLSVMGMESLGDIELTFQPNFHGEPLRLTVRFKMIDWTMPSEDWASFTFVSTHKLACAPVASRSKFMQLKPWEKVYMTGCAEGFTPFCRQGFMSSTHNQHRDLDAQIQNGRAVWHLHPNKFFRVSMQVWYGDSGSAIFNSDGEIIGLVNGFPIMSNAYGPVNFIVASTKCYLIKELTKDDEDFFKVEDE